MKESVRAKQFLYVKHALQYVNGHAAIMQMLLESIYKTLVAVTLNTETELKMKKTRTLQRYYLL